MSVKGDNILAQSGSTAEVNRIRDIIMGPQMRLYEQQFKRIVSQLDILGKEIEELRSRLDQQRTELSSHSDKERTKIQTEARQATDQVRQDLTARADKLDADLKAQANQLSADLRAQGQSLRTEFSTALDAMEDDKASRDTVGDLLVEMGTRLKEQAGIADLLGQLGDLVDESPSE